MTRQMVPARRLMLEVRACGSGEGFDVDAACGCGWHWLGWAEEPARAAEQAALEWDEHACRGRQRTDAAQAQR